MSDEMTGAPVSDAPSSPQSSSTPSADSSSSTPSISTSSSGSAQAPDVSSQALGSSTTSGQPAPVPTLFDRIRDGYGIDFSGKYRDENQLLQGLVHASRLVGQRNQHAEIGQLYGHYLPQFQEFLKQQQAQGQQQGGAQPQPTEKPTNWWNPPAWNTAYNQWLGEDGRPIENAPLDVRAAADKLIAFRQQHAHDLVNNFDKVLNPAFEHFRNQLLQEVRSEYAQQQNQVQSKFEADGLVQQNANWIYAHDQSGRRLTDEFGRPLLTQAGQTLVGRLLELNKAGLQDQRLAMTIAALLTQRDLGLLNQQQAQQAPIPIPQAALHSPNSGARGANGDVPAVMPKGAKLKDYILKHTRNLPESAFDFTAA